MIFFAYKHVIFIIHAITISCNNITLFLSSWGKIIDIIYSFSTSEGTRIMRQKQTELRGKVCKERREDKFFFNVDCSLLRRRDHFLLTGFPPNLV